MGEGGFTLSRRIFLIFEPPTITDACVYANDLSAPSRVSYQARPPSQKRKYQLYSTRKNSSNDDSYDLKS
jgi:hypothetical protein